jgi:hypothetical protein
MLPPEIPHVTIRNLLHRCVAEEGAERAERGGEGRGRATHAARYAGLSRSGSNSMRPEANADAKSRSEATDAVVAPVKRRAG